jgi:hypothetical protein
MKLTANGYLVNRKYPWIWARINSDGELQWSDGRTSEVNGGICDITKESLEEQGCQ